MEMISQTDKERLEAQLSDCLKFRPVIAGRIAEARAQGDLKENADYHAAREDQAMNEAIKSETFVKGMTTTGSQVPAGMSVADLDKFYTQEVSRYRALFKAANVEPQ